MITFRAKSQFENKTTLFFLTEGQAKKINKDWPQIQRIIKSTQFTAKLYDIFPVILNTNLLLLVGLGKMSELTLTNVRIATKKALESKYLKTISDFEIIPHNLNDESILAIIEGIKLGFYQWDKYISKDSEAESKAKQITIIAQKKKLYDEASLICDGVNFTRDLVNDNADVITSKYFEKISRDMIKGHTNIKLKILNAKELKKEGLNLHLAVNRGSNKEPKLIILKYTGNLKDKKYTAIIGKGITFDSGGLNLKPTSYIESMRQDMSGAGAVLGTLKTIIDLQVKKNVIFVLSLAENAIGSGAYKPGDVIKSYANKTVEIGNTDAEGRLLLADAIAYTLKNYNLKRIIDVATLTGACVVALGYDYTGLISSSNKLATDLLNSAKKTDDRAWRLPLYAELKDALKSSIADMKNLGWPKGAAGTLTAAEFLHQFTDKTDWAHLDIAGTAFVDSAERLYFNYGATGSSVRLLIHYIRNYA